MELDRAIGSERRIHLRGLHYALLGRPKPNGLPYTNTDADWTWLATPAKAARFLGYVGFERIFDARNAPPVCHIAPAEPVETWVSVGRHVDIPSVYGMGPRAGVSGFEGRQAYHLVIFGEKTSLADVVLPIAERFGADVYLPSGEISDTLLHEMAAAGAADGRPMVVFTLADCDPSGHQMPISIGRKLQALKDLLYPDLQFEVRPVALTVEQVLELGLPSTPLKATERRAGRWQAAFGVEQTEIDSLATLRPDVLTEILNDAIGEFFDKTLERRTAQARDEWYAAAQAAIADQTDQTAIEETLLEADAKLDELRDEIEDLNDRLREAVGDPKLPPVAVPEPLQKVPGKPSLISSAWPWAEQTRALRASKAYEDAEGGHGGS